MNRSPFRSPARFLVRFLTAFLSRSRFVSPSRLPLLSAFAGAWLSVASFPVVAALTVAVFTVFAAVPAAPAAASSASAAASSASAAPAAASSSTPRFADEQTLADADWFERRIGAGVVLRQALFDNLYGSRQSVSYIEADLDHPEVAVEFAYLPDSRQKISEMIPAQHRGAVGGINGTYFDTAKDGGGHVTYLRVGGEVVPAAKPWGAPWGWQGAIARDAEGRVAILRVPEPDWSADTAHPDILANGPTLLVAGAFATADFAASGGHCSHRHPRSAVGLTGDNRLVLLAIDGRTEFAAGMTCEETARVLLELGCLDGLNLDGGGSTTLWARGEPHDGVMNFPSDNGTFDHAGERVCSNAIAILAPPPAVAAEWDARLVEVRYEGSLDTNARHTATVVYENIGGRTWTAAGTTFATARPAGRLSPLSDGAGWATPTQPARMTPDRVAPGERAIFAFDLVAPDVPVTEIYDEFFRLAQAGVGRIGPPDHEVRMRLVVQPPVAPRTTFLVESRRGGRNFGWYSDKGLAGTGANCTAPGTTGGIGMRHASTYRSIVGPKSATVAPRFPEAGRYRVSVTWGAMANRRSPIAFRVEHRDGVATFELDQTQPPNVWYPLGEEAFAFEVGPSGRVVMSNERIDVSGSMAIAAVKFEYIGPAEKTEATKTTD